MIAIPVSSTRNIFNIQCLTSYNEVQVEIKPHALYTM
jgi:hypothetical protein